MSENLTYEKVLAMAEELEARDPLTPIVNQLREKKREMEARGGQPTHLVVHPDHEEIGGIAAHRLELGLLPNQYAPKDAWFLIDARLPERPLV